MDSALNANSASCSPQDLYQEEATALAHHRPQACAVEDHVFHHEHPICAVGDHLPRCNPPVCAVGDHVLLESKKEQMEEPREPTQQELVIITSEEAGFSKTVVKSSEPELSMMLAEEALHRIAKNLPNQHLLKAIESSETSLERPKLVPVLDVFVFEDRGLLWIDIEVSSSVQNNLLRNGRVNRQNLHWTVKGWIRRWWMEEPQSSTPSPKSPICASGDWLRSILKSDRHHRPTHCTQANQVLPKSHRWKTLVYNGLERKKFARAKDDLQRTHESCQIRAEFPRRWRRLFQDVSHTESQVKASEHRSIRNHRRVVGTILMGIE